MASQTSLSPISITVAHSDSTISQITLIFEKSFAISLSVKDTSTTTSLTGPLSSIVKKEKTRNQPKRQQLHKQPRMKLPCVMIMRTFLIFGLTPLEEHPSTKEILPANGPVPIQIQPLPLPHPLLVPQIHPKQCETLRSANSLRQVFNHRIVCRKPLQALKKLVGTRVLHRVSLPLLRLLKQMQGLQDLRVGSLRPDLLVVLTSSQKHRLIKAGSEI